MSCLHLSDEQRRELADTVNRYGSASHAHRYGERLVHHGRVMDLLYPNNPRPQSPVVPIESLAPDPAH
jgi:hypothetical protein